jgi:S1-C subfamily serine protease/tetratricopeptide (TPR) repeat protein
MSSDDVDKLITFGQMALEQGWYEKARDYFEQALALDASNEEAWFQLAKLADEREEALSCLDKVLSINPRNVEARRMIGRFRRERDPDELREMLQLAIEIGDKKATRDYCLKILDIDPSDEQAWITLGRSCEDWDEALSHFQQALAINPESEQAKVEIKRVLEQKEDHCWAFAEGAMESGDKERVRKYLHKVLEINPRSEKAWLKLGQLASAPQEALGYFEHVLTINPANERARAAIRQTKEEQEAERLRAQQALEQAKAAEELERLGHFVFRVSEEPVEPPRKVVGKWSIPSVTRIGQIGVVLVAAILVIWFTTSHLKSVPTPVTESTVPPRTVVAVPTPTMTYREAIELAQRATVAIGVIDGEWCKHIGSGSIIDPRGLIITNAHVVEGRTLYCIVRAEYLEGETRWYYNARVAKRDTSMDLALLSIESHSDGSSVSDLSLDAVPMGDSFNVHTGDRIYVCGYPKIGGHNVTVTQGLVSGFEENRTLIKTDTEISPGSSGGIAITENGWLIGIPTSVHIAPWGSGKIGYLIAVNEVRRFLGIVEDSEKRWVTPTPKPTAMQKPVYTGPLVLATFSGKGDTITDNFQLPECQQAIVYWSLSPSDYVVPGIDIKMDYLNVYLHKGTQARELILEPFLFGNNPHNGWVLQSFDGGIYYLLTMARTDAAWTIRVECRDGIAPIRTGMDLHATGDIITDPYELSACQKSVFVWSVEPDDSSSASIRLRIELCGKDLQCISIVDVIELNPTVPLKGETLQPLSGGVYFLVSKNARGQSWSVRWECRD